MTTLERQQRAIIKKLQDKILHPRTRMTRLEREQHREVVRLRREIRQLKAKLRRKDEPEVVYVYTGARRGLP